MTCSDKKKAVDLGSCLGITTYLFIYSIILIQLTIGPSAYAHKQASSRPYPTGDHSTEQQEHPQSVTGQRVLENLVYELHRYSQSIWVYHNPDADPDMRSSASVALPVSAYLTNHDLTPDDFKTQVVDRLASIRVQAGNIESNKDIRNVLTHLEDFFTFTQNHQPNPRMPQPWAEPFYRNNSSIPSATGDFSCSYYQDAIFAQTYKYNKPFATQDIQVSRHTSIEILDVPDLFWKVVKCLGKNYELLITRHPVPTAKPVNIISRIADIPVTDRTFIVRDEAGAFVGVCDLDQLLEMQTKLAPYEQRLLQAELALDEFDGHAHFAPGASPNATALDRSALENTYRQTLTEVSGPMQLIRAQYVYNCPRVAQEIAFTDMELFLDGLMAGITDLYGEEIVLGFLQSLGLVGTGALTFAALAVAFPPIIPILTILGVAIISTLIIVASVDFSMMLVHIIRGEYFELGQSTALFLGQIFDILLLNGLGKILSTYGPAKDAVEYLAHAIKSAQLSMQSIRSAKPVYIVARSTTPEAQARIKNTYPQLGANFQRGKGTRELLWDYYYTPNSPRYTGGSQGHIADAKTIPPQGNTQQTTARGNIVPPTRANSTTTTSPRTQHAPQTATRMQNLPTTSPTGSTTHASIAPTSVMQSLSEIDLPNNSMSTPIHIGSPARILLSDLDEQSMQEIKRKWEELEAEALERQKRQQQNGATIRDIVDNIIKKLGDPSAMLTQAEEDLLKDILEKCQHSSEPYGEELCFTVYMLTTQALQQNSLGWQLFRSELENLLRGFTSQQLLQYLAHMQTQPDFFYSRFNNLASFATAPGDRTRKSQKVSVEDVFYDVTWTQFHDRKINLRVEPTLNRTEFSFFELQLYAAGYSKDQVKHWHTLFDDFSPFPYVVFSIQEDENAAPGKLDIQITHHASLVPIGSTKPSDDRLQNFGLGLTQDALQAMISFLSQEARVHITDQIDIDRINMDFFPASIQYQTFRRVLQKTLEVSYGVENSNMDTFLNLHGKLALQELIQKVMRDLSSYPAFQWLDLLYQTYGLQKVTIGSAFDGSQAEQLQDILDHHTDRLDIFFQKPIISQNQISEKILQDLLFSYLFIPVPHTSTHSSIAQHLTDAQDYINLFDSSLTDAQIQKWIGYNANITDRQNWTEPQVKNFWKRTLSVAHEHIRRALHAFLTSQQKQTLQTFGIDIDQTNMHLLLASVADVNPVFFVDLQKFYSIIQEKLKNETSTQIQSLLANKRRLMSRSSQPNDNTDADDIDESILTILADLLASQTNFSYNQIIAYFELVP